MLLFALSGCSSRSSSGSSNADEKASVTVITAEEALSMMNDSQDLLILDVRTTEEYAEGHVKNAVVLPYDSITADSKELPEDKSTTILVYCRSGRRSAIAAQTLIDLGYTSIYDFGGIIDWPYEVVTD